MTSIRLLVGLRNPGDTYCNTRHNAGAWLIERFAAVNHALPFKLASHWNGMVSEVAVGSQQVRLLLPTTWMNLSGQSVGAICRYYQLLPQEVLIAHDELDLPPGAARLKRGGGHAGHNGLRNIIEQLSQQRDFYRLRIGIGHPIDRHQVKGFVLTAPTKKERQLIDASIDSSISALSTLFTEGFAHAMNQLHGSIKLNEGGG